MSRTKLIPLFALAVALVASIPALAASKTKSDSRPLARSTFNLMGNETLGGTALKAGVYLVTANDSKISFWRNDKLVAESPIQWKPLDETTQRNTLVLDSGKILEVRFAGKSRSVVVQQP